MALTRRQLETFLYLQSFADRGEPLPSVREIGIAFGLRGINAQWTHLKALERKGWIAGEATRARAYRLLRRVYPVLGETDGETVSMGGRTWLVVEVAQ